MFKKIICKFKKIISFKGRISQREYGLTMLIYCAYCFSLGFFDRLAFFDSYDLVPPLFIPALWIINSQGAKRCHDLGHSGWHQLIPLYVFCLLLGGSDYGENKYGLNPKGFGCELYPDDISTKETTATPEKANLSDAAQPNNNEETTATPDKDTDVTKS
jgi:uncharacterized membrane protein YhaH (DUF805 family)